MEYQYDPLSARFSRIVKANNIFNLAASTSLDTTATIIASGSVGGNRQILLTTVGFSTGFSSATIATFDVTAGDSTIMSHTIEGSQNPFVLSTGRDAPWARVDGTTVVSMEVVTAAAGGTISGFLSGVIEPKIESLESK